MSAVMPEKVLVTDLKNGVKVHADWPHLVSFGGGRLSTAVTILPLKEGLTTLGSSPDRDIVVAGTGVQRDHCRIRNDDGLVILEPSGGACLVTIDGVRVEKSTILSQGCMVCIGRSNYYRFNHPEQAAQLRSILPANSRVSMVPLQYSGDPKSDPLAGDTESALKPDAKVLSGRGLGASKTREDVGTDTDESFSSKLKRFEALTSAGGGKTRGDVRDGQELPGPDGSRLQAHLTSDSRKPSYLSYISEKLFAQCISGSAPPPSGGTASAVLEGFYRERSDSNSSSSSSSTSGSCTDSSTGSNGSSGEPGTHGRHEAAVTAAAAGLGNNASAAATAAAASDDAYLRQAQPLLLRRQGLRSGSCGSRTPSYDIKTLSMLSTETSVWGSTSSVATALADDGDVGTPPVATPLRAEHGYADGTFISNWAAEEEEDDYYRHYGYDDDRTPVAPSAGLRIGIARTEHERSGPPFSLHPAGAQTPTDAALWLKHSRSVEERRLAEEAERCERRRLDEILVMCAEYELKTGGPSTMRSAGRSDVPGAATAATSNNQTRRLVESSPAVLTMVADSAAPAVTAGSRRSPNDGPGSDAAAAQPLKTAPATALQPTGAANASAASSEGGTGGARVPTALAGSVPSIGAALTQQRLVATAQPQRAVVTVAAVAVMAAKGPSVGGTTNGAGTWPVLSLHDDEEHAYDVPSALAVRLAPAPVDDATVVQPDTSRLAAAAAHHSQEERIYDDPATCLSTVDASPPVPVRLRAAATVTKTAEIGTGASLHAAGRESGKTAPDLPSQQRSALPAASQPTATSTPPPAPAVVTSLAADARAQLQQLSRSRQEIAEVLAGLLGRIAEAARQQETVVRQFELERARMEAEQRDDLERLQLQSSESARLKARQLDALARVAREQEEEAAKVERARSRMEALEQRRELLLAERTKRSQRAGGSTGAEESGSAADYYTSELEQLDGEMKDFEDLEFQQLEVETKFEEEKEEAQRELNRQHRLMQETINAAEEKLNARIQRQRELLQKAKADAEAAEHRRLALIADFKVQKERLLAADRRMRELDVMLTSRPGGSKDGSTVAATVALEDDLTWSSPTEFSNHMLMLRLKADEGTFSDARRKLDAVRMSTDDAPNPRSAASKAVPMLVSPSATEREHHQQQQTNGRADSEGSSIKSTEALSEADKTSFSGSDDVNDRRSELQQLLMQARAHVENADSGSFPSQIDMTITSESDGSLSFHGQLDVSSLDSSSANGDDIRLRDKNIAPQNRPLTRYLPARAELLDLRTYIEAAGHNVGACSHVILDEKSCRGYLLKVGYKTKSWNKRWFVFSREKKALLYYMDKHDSKPRGHIPFHAIEDVFVDHLKTVKTPHHKPLFCVKTVERPYHLIAKTSETMSIWIDVIFSGAEGYREF